jgi:hypothetical protein
MVEKEHSKTIKLQKQIAYKYKDKFVYKYRLNIPSNMIEKLGWQEHGSSFKIVPYL